MPNQTRISTEFTIDTERLLAQLVDHSRLTGDQIAAMLADLEQAEPALLDQWVIVCAGGHLYTDGDVHSAAADVRPLFYGTREFADSDLRAITARVEVAGVGGWSATVARLRELPTVERIPAVAVADSPTAEDIATGYPAPGEGHDVEFAVALPGGALYFDDDSPDEGYRVERAPDGARFTVYTYRWHAQQVAEELYEDMARQGITYPARVVCRHVVRVTGAWEPAAA